MTQVDVLYRYDTPPSEAATIALANLREVYGIRKVEFKEIEKTVRIEYDATRLTEPVVRQLVRRSGLNLVEEIALSEPAPPPPPPPAPPATAAPAAK